MPQRPEGSPAALLELRILDGPNLYFTRAACKVVLDLAEVLDLPDEAFRTRAAQWRQPVTRCGAPGSETRIRVAARLLTGVSRQLAGTAGVSRLAVRARPGPEPGQLTIAYPWRRRELAQAMGVALAEALSGPVGDLAGAPTGRPPSTPRPTIPVVAVTGTNGKTTTTRLIAHMSRQAGNVTGWSSTDGVFVDGEAIEVGDWSGYGGAGRVLADQRVQLAVLETARGGLLLRGAGARHNDVSVVTNVGADHLGMLGINTIDDLAEVKAIVPRITKEEGWCVLNAQDPRVLAMRAASKARPWVFSLDPDAPGVRAVLNDGGRAISVVDDHLTVLDERGGLDPLIALTDVPMTLFGLSRHDVANALAATAAGLAVGLPRTAVLDGLRSFSAEENLGRMNLWDVDGCVIVLDLAHNEEGLQALLAVVQGLRLPGGRVVAVVGTGGDRLDGQLREMGHLAAHGSDEVLISVKTRYLRGRTAEEIVALLRQGAGDVPAYDDEVTALRSALLGRHEADAVAFLCHQDRPECEDVLRAAGGSRMTAEQVRDRVVAAHR